MGNYFVVVEALTRSVHVEQCLLKGFCVVLTHSLFTDGQGWTQLVVFNGDRVKSATRSDFEIPRHPVKCGVAFAQGKKLVFLLFFDFLHFVTKGKPFAVEVVEHATVV